MKRFLLSVALCCSLFLIGLFCFMPSTEAQTSVLPGLLNLPAPPPPNPFYRPVSLEREENFFDKKNPPEDNASSTDLIDYWKHQNQFDPKYAYTIKPSDKSIDRLISEVEKNPELLSEMVNVFPESKETAEFVKRLYDQESSKRELDPSWRTTVKRWLTYHTSYFSDELFQTANQAADTKEYVTNQDEVLALARVDWDKAQPILERMLGNSQQPVSQTLARWAFYQHALATNNSLDADKYRKELQETVENKSMQPGNRDLAMDALVESGDYEGRDDWYYSLLEDETLYELRVNGSVYTGLTTLLNHSPDDKYVAKMIELAGNGNPTIRNAAVRNLATLIDKVKSPEIIKALLPWLENPKWAKEVGGERRKIVTALRLYQIPESVPGLIAMLGEKERVDVEISPNSNTATTNRPYNSAPSNVSVLRTTTVDSYPYRSAAISALETQKSSLAAGPLRQVFSLVESWERPSIVRALMVSNGFTINEQVEALEEVAKNINQSTVNMESNTAVNAYKSDDDSEVPEFVPPPSVRMANTNAAYRPIDPNDLKIMLGTQLVTIEEPSEILVKAVIDRINFQDKKNPQIATGLRIIIQGWKGAAINALLLRDLKDGKTNLSAIVKLLIIRKDLREKQLNEVNDIRGGSPTALGISACLLEQSNDYDAILDGDNLEAKTAMLGCARLIRAQLPVPKVAANLQSGNKLLTLAAERYLESEDSPEARQIVLSLHPNEAKVLGARVSFAPDETMTNPNYSMMTRELFASVNSAFLKFEPYYFYAYTMGEENEIEKKLQKEVKESKELLGVYSYNKNYVRIYGDKVVFSWEDDPARYRERNLSNEEFEGLKNFLVAQRVDELPPFLSACPSCDSKELLMLGRGGGRRVFVKADPMPEFFVELENIFAEMRRQPAQIHYYLENKVAGLEVLFADDNLHAETIWKNGEDFRLLIDDLTIRKQSEKEAEEAENKLQSSEENEEVEEEAVENKAELEKIQRQNQQIARQKQYASYTWYKFDKTKLLEPVAQPPIVEFIPPADSFAVQAGDQSWKSRAATVEIRSDQEGLYKISRGQFTKVRDGFYYKTLVTPNGRWAIATKISEEESDEEYGSSLMRINLLTNKEFKVKIESDYGASEPVAFIPSLGKVLLFSGYGEGEFEDSQREGDFYLLDPETGLIQPVKGEAHPLLQQTFRPLQAVAASPDLFWTALPDRSKNETQFGIYNAKTLAFKPLMAIPQIIFESMAMWVDESENKIYFVYEGQLLVLPLPKNR